MAENVFNFIDDHVGLQVASIALLSLALIPIGTGSFSSLRTLKNPSASSNRRRSTSVSRRRGLRSGSRPDYDSEEEDEHHRDLAKAITVKDTFLFPIIASGVVYIVSVLISTVNPDYINYVIAVLISVFSCAVFSSTAIIVAKNYLPFDLMNQYKFSLKSEDRRLCHLHVTVIHLLIFAASIGLSITYALTQHWIIGDLFAMSIAIHAIRFLTVDSFGTGFLLLNSMLAYDLFWVFGTDTMVHISKALKDAPTSVTWPRNINTYVFNKLLRKDQFFTMFGLGEIIVPGIFIAYCLRFDRINAWRQEKNKQRQSNTFSKPYYTAAMISYAIGAGASIYTVHFTKEPQSALLFVVPALITSTLGTALIRNELGYAFDFSSILDTFQHMSGYTDDERPARYSRPSSRAGRGRSTSKDVNRRSGRSVSRNKKPSVGVVEEAYEETKKVVAPYVEEAYEETRKAVTPYVEEAVKETKKAVNAVATKVQEQTTIEEDVVEENKQKRRASPAVTRKRRSASKTNKRKS